MKAMPQLVALRNERLAQQNNYNNKLDYDKTRNIVAQEVPPNQLNRDTGTRVIDLLSNRSLPRSNRNASHSNRSVPYSNRKHPRSNQTSNYQTSNCGIQ